MSRAGLLPHVPGKESNMRYIGKILEMTGLAVTLVSMGILLSGVGHGQDEELSGRNVYAVYRGDESVPQDVRPHDETLQKKPVPQQIQRKKPVDKPRTVATAKDTQEDCGCQETQLRGLLEKLNLQKTTH
jgi:hypothetical protein